MPQKKSTKGAGEKIRKAVILAGGLNTRLYPWSKVIPKAILPLGKKVAIQYLIEECIESGIKEIYVVVREKNSIIKKYFTSDAGLNRLLKKYDKAAALEKISHVESLGKYLKFVVQSDPQGEAHALKVAKRQLNKEPFAVLLGDVVFRDPKVPAIKQLMSLPHKDKSMILGQGRMVVTRKGSEAFEREYKKKEKIDLKVMDVFGPEEVTFYDIRAERIGVGTFEKYINSCSICINLLKSDDK